MNNKLWNNVKKWRDYYNSTPNGWVVATLISNEYQSSLAKISPSRRKKR